MNPESDRPARPARPDAAPQDEVAAVEVEVDARGLRCPLPVLRVAQAISALPEHLPGGARVRLLSTDPAARSDVPAFCRIRGLGLAAVLEGDQGPGSRQAASDEPVTAYEIVISPRPAPAP